FTEFSGTTTFTLLKADQNDSVGLYMRGNSNLSHGYFVDIFGDNTYDIVKVFPESSKDTFLISPTTSSAINPIGQQNKLTVVMKGSSIVLLINDKVVDSITDSNYTISHITIFAYVQGKSSKTSSNGNSAVSPTARKATPTPTPTAQSTPQPLFSDDFTDKSKGWYLGSTSGYTRVIDNNTLTLADSNHTILTE